MSIRRRSSCPSTPLAAEGGQLQLNAFEPIIARALCGGLGQLAAGLRVLADHCVVGIRARRDHLAAVVAGSTGLVTALGPALGYETACAIAMEAHRDGRPALDLVREQTALTEEQLAALLAPDVLTGRRTVA